MDDYSWVTLQLPYSCSSSVGGCLSSHSKCILFDLQVLGKVLEEQFHNDNETYCDSDGRENSAIRDSCDSSDRVTLVIIVTSGTVVIVVTE